MDKLGKQQKEELATALCILALYDGEVRMKTFVLKHYYSS